MTNKEMTNKEMTKAIANMLYTLKMREWSVGMGWHEASLYETLKTCKAHMESVEEFAEIESRQIMAELSDEFDIPSFSERGGK
jgi:hypothetical protein